MGLLLSASYVVHVLSALFWIGAVLFVAYRYLSGRVDGSPADLGWTLDRLLRVTRWTGVALPVSGRYQVWVLYPIARLLGSTRGHLVLGMFGLRGVMNGVIEAGVYRTRTAAGATMGIGRHTVERFSLGADTDVTRLASVVRPYVLVASGLGLLLLVDAALLAGGLPV